VVGEVLSQSGLLEELQRSEDPQDASRVENLSQLQSVAAEFEQNTPDATLAGFLETTALVADSDQLPSEGEDSGKVTLMTLHTAKGLEYPVVFLTGMEQEFEIGMLVLAVPLTDREGTWWGALSLTSHQSRTSLEALCRDHLDLLYSAQAMLVG